MLERETGRARAANLRPFILEQSAAAARVGGTAKASAAQVHSQPLAPAGFMVMLMLLPICITST